MRTGRFGGLDGLRAIAVGLVLCYHLVPGSLRGGFLGVDVFFVISGFLITSLLLREYARSGRIRLVGFWRRRARRLLPALGIVLLVSASLAALVGGDLLVGIGRQIAGAAFFVSNWVFIATGADYFARDTPELFRNTWSLAIEEQFYVVLPLLVIVLMKFRGRLSRILPLLGLGLASAALMVEWSLRGEEATRIYFGSDTHVFGLLLGAALAMLVTRMVPDPAPAALTPVRQAGLIAATALGLGILGWLAWTLPEGSPASFQGGFQLATGAALLTVWAVTREGAWAGRALDVAPLRWVGERSYGIYLWHWPLLLIIGKALGPGQAWATAALTLACTILVSAVSYRYVEQPVRNFGLRRSLRLLLGKGPRTTRRWAVTAGIAGMLVVTVPATAYAVITAPPATTAAEAIARGQQALDERAASEEGAGSAGAQSDAADPSGGGAGSGAGSGSGSGTEKAPTGPVVPVGTDITAVGDSVMLASLPELETAFPGISVDAAVSRGMGAGVGLIAEQADRGELRRVLLVGLGTNGPVDPADLDELVRLAGNRPVVLVNAHADRDWVPGVNDELNSFAASRRGVVVADWTGAVTGVPDALAGDDIHPNPSGGEIYASSVQKALDELETPSEAIGFALPRR
ncbi:acyltransferase family protein [Leucobacter luti]|uniref:acyltransferase family protein n=1 Tax=Leucobacter luti TaxID=340320 RepID=UPI003D022AD3